MKHLWLLFFCFFYTNTALYGMEQKSDGVDHGKTETFLNDYCKTQLERSLEKYKNDEFTPQDMNNLLEVLFFVTGYDDSIVEYIHTSRDGEENGFFQYALKKIDVPVVQWLIERGNVDYHSEKECNDFVAFCAEQLLPYIEDSQREAADDIIEGFQREIADDIIEDSQRKGAYNIVKNIKDSQRKAAYNIVKNVIEYYKDHSIFQSCSERFVKNIIKLQLQHKALKTQFSIDEQLIIPFLPQDQTNLFVELSSLYQTTKDKDGNTLAHIAAQQHDADELCRLMKNNRISKTVENNDQKTVALLAFDKFKSYMIDTTSLDIHKKEAQGARCCYFMLKKYFAEGDFDRHRNCCNEHVVTKRYETINSLQKNISQSYIQNTSPINSPLILPEEPKNSRCCGWLLNFFKEKQD